MIDLIDKISEIVGFEYDLYYSPDLSYGRVDVRGIMNGMVGEVYNAVSHTVLYVIQNSNISFS